MGSIKYQLRLESGKIHSFEIDIERSRPNTDATDQPHGAWTDLKRHQCSNCPVTDAKTTHCPAALDIESIANEFRDISSVERVDVTVTTPDRSYFKNCDAQDALVSLFGLVMASSECPILSRLKPLAHSHLPFATMIETATRLVGSYLIKQRLLSREGDACPDWDLLGIEQFYEELNTVNGSLIRRLQDASRDDANGNAINILFSMTSLITFGIDDTLDELAPLARQLL